MRLERMAYLLTTIGAIGVTAVLGYVASNETTPIAMFVVMMGSAVLIHDQINVRYDRYD